jgi:two-component system chemotaxis response regulator CheY
MFVENENLFANTTRFLVVDDFKTMRTILKKTLNDLGYRNISEAENGQEAFKILQTAANQGMQIECIISDWNMPKMTGIELLKKVRADEIYKEVPFMLVTGEDEKSQVIEAAQAGVSNYIVKPSHLKILKIN